MRKKIRCKSSFHFFEVTDEKIVNLSTDSLIPETTQKAKRIRRFTSGKKGVTILKHKETGVKVQAGSIKEADKKQYEVFIKDSLANRFEVVE